MAAESLFEAIGEPDTRRNRLVMFAPELIARERNLTNVRKGVA